MLLNVYLFQVVVMAPMLRGVDDVCLSVDAIKHLIGLLGDKREEVQMLAADCLASLARTRDGIPSTIVLAGGLHALLKSLMSPVVSVGYFLEYWFLMYFLGSCFTYCQMCFSQVPSELLKCYLHQSAPVNPIAHFRGYFCHQLSVLSDICNMIVSFFFNFQCL